MGLTLEPERRGNNEATKKSKWLSRASRSTRIRRWGDRMGLYIADDSNRALWAKVGVNIYLSVPAYLLFKTCDPWYTYFHYLTVWGWTTIQIYFGYSLYLDLRKRFKRDSGEELSMVATYVAQALSEVAFAVCVVVTSFFWVVIYPKEKWRRVSWELHMHGVSLVLMVLDYLYRFTGFHLRNHKFVLCFATLYCAVHMIVVYTTGRPIYPGVDFTSPSSFFTLSLGVTTMIVSHKLMYLWHNWSRMRSDWKTVCGITEFFLIPRHDSLEFLGDVGEEADEDSVPESESLPVTEGLVSEPLPCSVEPRGKASVCTDSEATETSVAGRKRDGKLFQRSNSQPTVCCRALGMSRPESRTKALLKLSRRLGSFTYRELLSVHPSGTARSAAAAKRDQ